MVVVKNRVNRDWMRALRQNMGLSTREIAKQLGMSFSYYSDIENGRRNPSIEKSMNMAKFFDVDIKLFLTNRVKFSEKVD